MSISAHDARSDLLEGQGRLLRAIADGTEAAVVLRDLTAFVEGQCGAPCRVSPSGEVRLDGRAPSPEDAAVLAVASDLAKIVLDRERRAADLALALSAARMGTWVADLESGEERWSPEQEALYGLAPGEFEGTTAAFLAFVHPDDRADVASALNGVRSGESYRREFRAVLRSGEVRWMCGVGRLDFGPDGSPRRVLGVNYDITAQKAVEHALEDRVRARTVDLERQGQFMNALLSSLSDAIVACDANGDLALFNEATVRLHGLPPEPLPADAWTDHYHLYRADGVTPLPKEEIPLFRAFSGERVRDIEMIVKPVRGEPRFVLSDGAPIRSPEGELLGAVVAMRDLTERRRAEVALLRSNTELERFAYITSHDLQEPIRTVSSFAGLLSKRYGPQLDDRGRTYLDLILQGAGRMKHLVDDLLAFSRLEGDAGPLRPVDLGVPLSEALTRLRARVDETGARITIGELPTVIGDGPAIAQLFQNLISNALKFQLPNVVPEVEISAAREDESWHVTVSDNGIGIEAAYLDKIFVLFQRLNPRDKYEGTGLGLGICQKIVERHGGRIWAESTPDEGSTFHFTLPAS